MNRFHVHVAANNIVESVTFYTTLFGQPPSEERRDYAHWTLEDPPLTFALSARGHAPGINHLGIDSEKSAPADEASQAQACCDAKRSDRWLIDPQGLAWERTRATAHGQTYHEMAAGSEGRCCIPIRGSSKDQQQAKTECCIPLSSRGTSGSASRCCG